MDQHDPCCPAALGGCFYKCLHNLVAVSPGRLLSFHTSAHLHSQAYQVMLQETMLVHFLHCELPGPEKQEKYKN